MGYGAILVENLLSRVQFPLHTFTATEEAAGKPVERIGSGRRSSLWYWTGNTANLQQDITGTFDRLRAMDMIAIDRNNNLAGKTVALHVANEPTFTNPEVVFSVALPAATMSTGLDNGLGTRTEEGAWVMRFPTRYARYARIRIAAVASYKPLAGGIYLGKSWTLPGIEMPWSEDGNDPIGQEAESSVGWMAKVNPGMRKSGSLRLKLGGLFDYDQARYHLGGHFALNRPMWICFDDSQADRSFLALRQGRIDWRYDVGWGYRQAEIGYLEHEALAA